MPPSSSMMHGHRVIARILSPFLRWLDRRIEGKAQPFLGSTCRVSVCPHPVHWSVCCLSPMAPKCRSSSTAVTFIGSSQRGHGGLARAGGFASSAATRSSSSLTRFGRPMTAFQPGT